MHEAFILINKGIRYFLGPCDKMIYTLFAFVVVEYVTKVMCALVDRKLYSEVGLKGICQKILIFLIVGVTNLVDMNVVNNGNMLRTMAVLFYISSEGMNLLKNAEHLGLPIPRNIKIVLRKLWDRGEKEDI